MMPKEKMKEYMKNPRRTHVVQVGFVLDLAMMSAEDLEKLGLEIMKEKKERWTDETETIKG